MLLATMARLRADRAEQEELLEEATALLRRGKPRDIDWHRRTQYREMLNNGYRQLMDRERTRGSFHPLGGIGTMRVSLTWRAFHARNSNEISTPFPRKVQHGLSQQDNP